MCIQMTRFGLMTGAVTIIEPRLFLSLVTFRKKRSRHFSTPGNRPETNLQVQRERFFSIQAYIGQIRHYGIGILYDPLSLSAGFFSGLSRHGRNAVRTEAFHVYLLGLVLPLSIVALLMGCRKHRSRMVALLGFAGLTVLVIAASLGHDGLGETGERAATLAGSTLIALGHLRNFSLCRRMDCEQ